MTLDVLNVIEFGRQGVVHVNDYDLPVRLALVKQSHDTENLDLFNLTSITDLLANLADVQRIVVTLGFGLNVTDSRVLPRLRMNDR